MIKDHSQMYKVFYNQKLIYLTTELIENSNEFPLFFAKYTTVNSLMKALKSKKVSGVYFYHPNKEKLEQHFFKRFPKVEAAGGLVEHKDGRFLFIYRNNKWDLPKGKIEKKEILIDGALREVMEETGAKDLIVKKSLNHTYHLFSRNGNYKLKKTYWFLMTTSYEGLLEPQLEEGITKAEWKTKEELPVLMENAYENIKLLFEEMYWI